MIKIIKNIFISIVLSIFKLKRRESKSWDSLYRAILYHFNNENLLKQALTHRSFLQNDKEGCKTNERLEFLGDAVLGLIVTDELYHRFPQKSEGELTKIKSLIVSREVLAQIAKKIGLGRFLILGSGEERSGGRNRQSILSDTFEALLGAIYLDSGISSTRRLVNHYLFKNIDKIVDDKFYTNFKSWLLEYVQAQGSPSPVYHMLYENGPDHKKIFTIEVLVNGKVLGIGRGKTKKQAEQAAAFKAVKELGLISNKE
jgi:ribonuclease-3